MSPPAVPRPEHPRLARAAALLLLIGGLLALAAEIVLRPVPYLDAAAVLATLASVGVLARLRVAGRSRPAQIALALWVASLLLELAVATLVPGGSLDEPVPGTRGGPGVTWAYGVDWALVLLTGPVVAGIAIGRARVLNGWRRWVPLAFGLALSLDFLPVVLGHAVGAGAVIDDVADAARPVFTLLFVIALLTAFHRSAWVERWQRSGSALGSR
jgi:hypothetical protein